MCILFLYVAKGETLAKSTGRPSIKLIVASNRDEVYSRPTKQADFWDSDPNILGGRDCLEGGTWLGITKTGKLVVLLNIMSQDPTVKLKSRGDLVTGFLRSDPSERGWTYCSNLHQSTEYDIRKDFGLFNLIAMDLVPLSETTKNKRSEESQPDTGEGTSGSSVKSAVDITYITNGSEKGPRILSSENENEFFGFGNTIYDTPFAKVTQGRREFEDAVRPKLAAPWNDETRNEIKEAVLRVLKNPTRHFPDPLMEAHAKNMGVTKPLAPVASVFVDMGAVNYGTRTHTIIIVDSDDNVDYHEWTLAEPIDFKNLRWIESQYTFKIKRDS